MGISVKCRSQREKRDFTITLDKSDLDGVEDVCKTFGATPYFAFVFDLNHYIRAVVISKDQLMRSVASGAATCNFKMSDDLAKGYRSSRDMWMIELEIKHDGLRIPAVEVIGATPPART